MKFRKYLTITTKSYKKRVSTLADALAVGDCSAAFEEIRDLQTLIAAAIVAAILILK